MQDDTTTGAAGAAADTILRGAGVGLAPAAVLYLGAVVAFGVISLLHAATTGLGFLAQLPILNVMSLLCLAALANYAASMYLELSSSHDVRRMLRQ